MRIAIDIDDVLAQFYPAMCVRFAKPCNRINIWDGEDEAAFVRHNMHIVEANHRFWLNLNPLSRPEDITFEFDCYLTSSPLNMKSYREDWLAIHGFPRKPVIITNDKASFMVKEGLEVLIDDKPSTLEAVRKAGLIAIQYIPSYMSDERLDLNPIRHLSQVNEIINKLNKIE